MVQLNDPHGDTDWTGPWHSSDFMWQQFPHVSLLPECLSA